MFFLKRNSDEQWMIKGGTMFTSVPLLVDTIEEELRKDISLPKEIIQAATKLSKELASARQSFCVAVEKATDLLYEKALVKFAQKCHTIIYKYQPKIMSAPGLWNQIKAVINSFIEKYWDRKSIFKTEKSFLHTNLRKIFEQTKGTTQNDCFISLSSLAFQ